MNNKITIIGIADKIPEFTAEQIEIINSSKNFAGGKRHYELVKQYLPGDYMWENIAVPLSNLLNKLKSSTDNWVVLASGDPLFFGIANTIIRELTDTNVEVYPTFNSLQLLGHCLKVNYGEYKIITLTGRSWNEFDKALILGESKMALLTDRKKTPQTIAKRMLAAGITNYKMIVGECLGGENETIHRVTLQEAAEKEFAHPNNLLLEQTSSVLIKKGIPESEMETLEGRPNMITKMPIRLTTLSLLNLNEKFTMWDIGACSGSITIDAKLNYPHLTVIPFEIREECRGIIQRNCAAYRVPGIEPIIGDFMQADTDELPKPDVAFLGGYGGKMDNILDKINKYLSHKGILAFNSVSSKSAEQFKNWIEKNNFAIKDNMVLTVDEFNPITIITAIKN